MKSLDEIQEPNFVLSKDLTRKIFRSDFKGLGGNLNYFLWKLTGFKYEPDEHQTFERYAIRDMRKTMGSDIIWKIRTFVKRASYTGNNELTLPINTHLNEDGIYPEDDSLLKRVYFEFYDYIRGLGKRRLKGIGRLEINFDGNIHISEIPPRTLS